MQLHRLWKTITVPLLFAGFCNAAAAQDEAEKKWEIGIGVGAVSGPDYRGSDEYRNFISPIPYVVYRGKIIRSDREGIRGNFLRTDQYEFTFSAAAAITPDADKNTLREGMPELGSTLELGPSFNINLTGASLREGWYVQVPWRAVFAIGADESGYIGSVFQPQLVFQHAFSEWHFSYRAGVLFASDSYHDYYYEVKPEYATETRSYFDADGGYSGWHNNIAFNRQFNYNGINTRLALFIRYDNIANTNFNDSSLVKTDHVYRGGFAFIWVIK